LKLSHSTVLVDFGFFNQNKGILPNKGDLVERDRNRQAAIWEWQAEHGKKLDEEKTQWIVRKIVTTKEDLERE